MKLHEDGTLFRQAITATAALKNIPEIFIEKDYWVTYALSLIFNDPIGEETVFKGGTALSKCFGLIDRFSEDIDLVVKQSQDDTDNQLKRKIKKISQIVNVVLPEKDIKGLTRKMGMNRKTAHSYPKIFQGSFGQVRDIIVVEATWFGYFEPYRSHNLNSYIYDMMIKQNQETMAEEFSLHPFSVNVLEPSRTLCEKIMSLVRFSYSENPIADLRNKIRHIYDLHKMLENPDLQGFFNSSGFDTQILMVAQDDVVSFRNNNEWLEKHPLEAFIFADVENCWEKLKRTFGGEFKDLVYGVFPEEKAVLQTLHTVKQRLSIVSWEISV
ncbi:MAG: nucleotidyl transferase AbiEii/AbiGii toxin family protein [Bacteroidetes bacterium]|nr:nucleotidyl transferase AbiEii/AbiGii toxin family protein [Bacteroidota bacterium]